MIALSIEQLADLWALKYGKAWVYRDSLDAEWEVFAKILLRKGRLDYESVNDPNKWGYQEVLKIKENEHELNEHT